MTLNDYIQNVRDCLRDDNANFYTDTQLARWINRARKQVAKIGQCVRVATPSLAGVSSITVTGGGSGYVTPPTVTIADPAGNSIVLETATATADVSGGQVVSITLTGAGSGYVSAPTVTIEGGGGTGATATATLEPHTITTAGQEVYTFASVNAVIQALYPGVGDILGIQSIAVAQGSLKPILDPVPWTWLQGYMRLYPYVRSWPQYWSQLYQGALGNFYLYPVPVEATQMELDVYCDVLDLSASQTTDMIPAPWEEAVTFYAAHLAYIYAQRPDDARGMVAQYEAKCQEARSATEPARIPTLYPGGGW